MIINTVGNLFSGQVVGETAKTLSERFGKILQKRHSISINRQDVSTSISTQMDSLIPPSKISGLTQGMFVGSVADNFGERIEQIGENEAKYEGPKGIQQCTKPSVKGGSDAADIPDYEKENAEQRCIEYDEYASSRKGFVFQQFF